MAIATDARLTIADAAAQAGVSAHTLRYYERAGLLAPIERDGAAGVVDAQLTSTLGGSPLLEDALRIDPACDARHVALPPGHRAVVSAALLGALESAGLDDRELLHCALPGTLRRATGEDLAAAESACAAAWTAFRGVVAAAAGDAAIVSAR